uniref:FLYWCH-type domain-containing protein n=1 Tax=Caenorhabditis tropicalis TaxID=1561998 RepID=A0A1I7UHB0_9PELO
MSTPKRTPRPIFTHNGFVLRLVKTLADGTGLLYCDMRQSIGCNASGKLINGTVFMKDGHNGHEPDYRVANAKLTRHHIKKLAQTSTGSPKQIIEEVQATFGPLALGNTTHSAVFTFTIHKSGSRDSIAKMIHRARQTKTEQAVPDNTTQQLTETTDDQSTSDSHEVKEYNVIGETLEDVLKRIKGEDSEENETDTPKNELVEESIEQPVVNPQENFFSTLIETIRETVKQEMQSAVKNIPSLSSTSIHDPSVDINTCVGDFLSSLESLSNLSNSSNTKERMKVVLHKIRNEGKKFSLEKLLESTLTQLEN